MIWGQLGERFPRPRSQQRRSLRPCARRVAVLGVGAVGGRPLPLRGSWGVTPGKIFLEIFDAKSRVWGQFGPENKLIEGQPNEYDVVYRNASVLAFQRWPTIFAVAPFRLQNICRNGVPPRSRTNTPLSIASYLCTFKYTVSQKNKTLLLLSVTSPNVSRFSKLID